MAILWNTGSSNVFRPISATLKPVEPTFSPVEGEFNETFDLTLSCATDAAEIYYTTDGTTPTTNSILYSSPLSITAGSNHTIKAIAYLAGMTTDVVSATYEYKSVAKPVITPASGTVLYGSTVAISCVTENTEIYYTLDGSTPTAGSTKYTSPIVLTESKTIKAIAINDSEEISNVSSADLTVQATAPTFSVEEGTYNEEQTVTLLCTTDGATIYYTTDGSTPTSSSTAYSSAISINQSTTLKAIAIKSGLTNSEISSAVYTLKVKTPTFSVPAGSYDETQSVEITCATEGVTIYYTNDATTPNSSKTPYSSAINVSSLVTLKAIATKSGWSNSDVATAVYTVVLPASLPFSFNSGKDAITSTKGLSHYGLGSDYSVNNTKLKFDATGDHLILKFAGTPGRLSFSIKGNSFSGGTFKVQTSVDGNTYNDLKEYNSLGEASVKVFDNINPDVRYIRWIYTSKSNGNVGLGNISLTKTIPVEISSVGWATFANNKALDFTGLDVEAYIITGYSGTAIEKTQMTGSVPANTPLLLKADEGTYSIPVVASSATDVAGNKLVKGTGEAVGYEDGYSRYVLGISASSEAEFQQLVKDGAEATVATNKAYLQFEETPGAPAIIRIVDEENNATAIQDVEAGEETVKFLENGQLLIKKNGVVYDVMGRIVK